MKIIKLIAVLALLATFGLTSSSRADTCACLDRDDSGADDDLVCCPAVDLEYVPTPSEDAAEFVCGSIEITPDTFAAGCVGNPVAYGGSLVNGCVSVEGVTYPSSCEFTAASTCIICGCDRTEYDAEACGGDADCSDPASTHDKDGEPCPTASESQ